MAVLVSKVLGPEPINVETNEYASRVNKEGFAGLVSWQM